MATRESKSVSLVSVFEYRLSAHNLGGATDTGVAKVIIFIEVLHTSFLVGTLEDGLDFMLAREYTGTLIGGGGGMLGEAKAIMNRVLDVLVCLLIKAFCIEYRLEHDEINSADPNRIVSMNVTRIETVGLF